MDGFEHERLDVYRASIELVAGADQLADRSEGPRLPQRSTPASCRLDPPQHRGRRRGHRERAGGPGRHHLAVPERAPGGKGGRAPPPTVTMGRACPVPGCYNWSTLRAREISRWALSCAAAIALARCSSFAGDAPLAPPEGGAPDAAPSPGDSGAPPDLR